MQAQASVPLPAVCQSHPLAERQEPLRLSVVDLPPVATAVEGDLVFRVATDLRVVPALRQGTAAAAATVAAVVAAPAAACFAAAAAAWGARRPPLLGPGALMQGPRGAEAVHAAAAAAADPGGASAQCSCWCTA